MLQEWGTGDMQTRFSWGNTRERDHLKDLVNERIILKWIFKKWGGKS
jgi:hypothetical protein